MPIAKKRAHKVALFMHLHLEKATNRGSRLAYQVLWRQFHLKASHPRTDKDVRKIHTTFMDEGGEMFLHANG